jgi:Delta24-sterol reductase
MDHHNAAVLMISKRVEEFYGRKKAYWIYHGSTNTTRRTVRSPNSTVDISSLNNVLSVQAESKIALVEPNVPMDKLVKETLKFGLVPPVVMEFPGITAGGAFAGTGGESSSFRWGTFDRIVNKIEVVLANGDIVWASDAERSDLFNGSAGAFGTLGIITLLEVQLVPARSKLVELHYHPVSSATEAAAKIREFCKPEQGGDVYRWEYVDGIMFSSRTGVVITGHLLMEGDNATRKVTARYSRARDDWYYSDIQSKLEARPTGWTDVVPITDYFFRYDRGAFWCARHSFDYLHLPFNGFTRWLLDGFMHTRELFNMLLATNAVIQSIIQDLCLPAKNLDVFVAYAELEFNLWPLWLCPIRPNAGRGIFQLSPSETKEGTDPVDDLWINVGLWGKAPPIVDEAIAANRRLEATVRDLGGYKWLYGQTFYAEDEFWSIYPRADYDALRLKYHATDLPNAYDKVRTDPRREREAEPSGWMSIWPLDAIVAILGAMTGLGRN